VRIKVDEEFEVDVESIRIDRPEVIIRTYNGYEVVLNYHELEWLIRKLLISALLGRW